MLNIIFLILICSIKCTSGALDLVSKFHQHEYKIKDFRSELQYWDKNLVNSMTLHTYKYNRSVPAVNGSFNFKIDIVDPFDYVIQFYKFASNEYRVFPLRLQLSYADVLKANAGGIHQSLTDCGNIDIFNMHFKKTLTVLNPFRTPDTAAVQDTDFAGPLVFCLAFGGFLLLSGKVHFSYIYGFGVLGCLLVWILLSLMSTQGVTLGTVVTVLGYCLLPMVGLSGVNVLFNLQGYLGVVLTSISILWCSLSASKLFVTALLMEHQQPLVLYPCALLYGVFALITIF